MSNQDREDLRMAPAPVELRNWPELLAKTVDDAAKLFAAELHLFEANLKATIEAQTRRLIGIVAAAFALAYGLLFVLGAVAVLLHKALPWWLALGITGLAVIAIGVIAQGVLSRMAARKTRSG